MVAAGNLNLAMRVVDWTDRRIFFILINRESVFICFLTTTVRLFLFMFKVKFFIKELLHEKIY